MPQDSERLDEFSDLFLDVTGVDFGRKSQVEHMFLSNTPPDTKANYNPAELVSKFLSNTHRAYLNRCRPPRAKPRTVNPEILR
jgi:hypothetical protein